MSWFVSDRLNSTYFHMFTPGLQRARLNTQTTRTSPGVRGLVSELRGHQGKVPPHPEPQVGLGDAAVVRVDGVDTGHLLGYQSERKRVNTQENQLTKLHGGLQREKIKSPPWGEVKGATVKR